MVDHRLLQFEPGAVGRDDSFLRREHGFGLGRFGREIAVVDDKENLADRGRLVVARSDLFDVALDFRADQRHVALHVRVVGRLQEAPDVPPIPAAAGTNDQQD